MYHKYLISKTPFRISLGGGGTDLPQYANIKGGEVISASINRYCNVTISDRSVDNKILVQTTSVELEKSVSKIKHAMIKGVLKYFNISKNIQISTFTSLPTRTGLGSSSTLMVGLVNAISKMQGEYWSQTKIAFVAHKIEREILKMHGGIQDQYISSFGGIKKISVNKNKKVKVEDIKISNSSISLLENGLIIIYSGKQRVSGDITKSIKTNNKKMIELFDSIKDISRRSIKPLKDGDTYLLGKLMDEHWSIKRMLSKNISSSHLDNLYNKLKKFGSPGGKIIGAGGGGFFMMAVPTNKKKYLSLLRENGFGIIDWKFEFKGSHIIDKNL